jgi:hypothetical protein
MDELSLKSTIVCSLNSQLTNECSITEACFILVACRRSRSQSCPFCRDSLKRVNSGDLWMLTDHREAVDMATVTRENIRRLFTYIEKLPLVTLDNIFDAYDSHVK